MGKLRRSRRTHASKAETVRQVIAQDYPIAQLVAAFKDAPPVSASDTDA